MTAQRELSLQYGETTIGGTSESFLLTDVHTVQIGFALARIEATFIVKGGSDSEFSSNVQDIEAAFRKPDQDLVVMQSGSKLIEWKQSANTGLDAMPSIVKRGDIADTARSRLYVVRIEFGMPASRADVDGLRSRTMAVSYDPSRRRHVTIAGEFTAFNATASRAQYEGAIESMCNSLLTGFTGTFELAAELASTTINDKSCTFSRTFDEVIYDQGGGGVGNLNIVRQSFILSRAESRDTPAGPGAQTWTVATINYECWIDKSRTQDLAGQWESIRTFVISKATAILGGTVVVFSEEPRYDYDNNRIMATVLVASAPNDLIEYTLTVSDRVQYGKVFVPVWNGSSNARYKYQGPSRYTRTITETTLVVGELGMSAIGAAHNASVADAMAEAKLPGVPDDAKRGSWEVIDKMAAPSPRVIGIDGNSQKITQWTATTTLELIDEVGPTTGSGGGGAVTPSGSGATPAGSV